MIFLAHAFLSFNNPDLLVGNLISDFVKGKQKFGYPPGIQEGIALHRAIDTFTDEHPATQRAKSFFRPAYRLYSGAFADVVYDHFLATDDTIFTETSLAVFAEQTYETLHSYSRFFPERFASMFPYMWKQNWLFHYRSKWGTEKSFGGVVRRAAYLNDSTDAAVVFETNYDALKQCYLDFFPEVYNFARTIVQNRTAP
jgi:acyl carrier protein phosphodiesterase